jgi:hypothetical protein
MLSQGILETTQVNARIQSPVQGYKKKNCRVIHSKVMYITQRKETEKRVLKRHLFLRQHATGHQ